MATMKSTLFALALAATISSAGAAAAADTPAALQPQFFGVVDTNKVVRESAAAKEVMSSLEGKRKEFRTEVAKEEDAVRTAGQEFDKQKETLSKDKLVDKRKE